MTHALSSSSNHLLPTGLIELHRKTIAWASTVELWRRELDFFKKLINEYGIKLKRRDYAKEREHFKMLLTFYTNRLMNSLSTSMVKHEARLKFLLHDGQLQNEIQYREEHHELEKQMAVFEQEFHCFKNELYILIEKVLIKNKMDNYDLSTVDNG